MKLMTLDGNSIINRAFYGIRPLSASDGTPTNAIYGFLAILQRLIEEERPDALCVAFDLPAPTFRHERYEDYKAHRKPMPDELRVQIPILKEILAVMKIPCSEQPGWEADDLLGAIAKSCEAEDCECVIVTGDKDSLQLISDFTRVKLVKTRMGQSETKDYTTAAFIEEYGFAPERMIDLKALMGDASDNIPGVAGVGEKTALELVRLFGGIDEIYARLDELDIKDSVRKKLEAGRERAELSYMLATIRVDAPIEISPADCMRKEPDKNKLYEIFKRLGFARMIETFGLKRQGEVGKTQETEGEVEIIEVSTGADAGILLDAAKAADFASIVLDSEFFDSIAVALPGTSKVYIVPASNSPLGRGDPAGPGVLAPFANEGGGPQGRGLSDSAFKELLSDSVKKAGHNIKDIIRACHERGLYTDGWVFDTALAAYLISPTDSNYEISRISERYCGYRPEADDTESGQMTMMVEPGKSLASSAYAVNLLKDSLSEKLKEMELEKLFYDIEMPLCFVLAEMEHEGFLVDRTALEEFGGKLSERIAETERQVHELAGESFNLNSPKQLGEVLFDKLMLPAPKKTKTGYSTNIEVLDHLAGSHPIIGFIKDYRELSKLKSTYADGLLKVIGSDGRIHTHFQMTVTATGRLSSTEPNLQNIPVRKEMGGELRKMFIAGPGNVLVDADYSQIELRLLAHIAHDPVMLEAFERGDDIHSVTASQVFGVRLSEVTAQQRGRAKAVNFGIVYGISSFSLANDIGVLPREAKEYIDNYLEKYSGVRKYMDEVVGSAKQLGYVSTLFGRRRFLPELKSSNFNTRSFGERVALNMPIQGTAADIIKIAMINVSKRLKDEGLVGQLILQVHDELIVECPEHEADAVSRVLREEMENAAQLSVPLLAQTRTGKSWHDTK